MKHYISLLYAFVLLVATSSCSHSNEPEPDPDPDVPVARRVVLVYQVANNNGLGPDSLDDLAEMQAAAEAGHVGNDGRLLVYHHYTGMAPVLYEVTPDGLNTLKTYSTSLSSASYARMVEVFGDVADLSPADSYGIILWGHGSGWLQDGISESAAQTKSYGCDNGKWMNITTLAAALGSGLKWDFVYFDCCFMASVEVAYQLRDVTPVIAGSVTEIAAEGMPYDRTISHFFSADPDFLINAAKETFAYYQEWQTTNCREECVPKTFSKRYCTISVFRTGGLEELASSVAEIYKSTPAARPADLTLTAYGRNSFANYYFDFGGYVRQLCFDKGGTERYAGASEHYARFADALAGVIGYKDDMHFVFGSTTPIPLHSGLSTFVPSVTCGLTSTVNYNTLQWYTDVASYLN